MLLTQLPVLYQLLDAARLNALRTQLEEIFKYYGEEWQTEVHHSLVAKEQELFALIKDRDNWVAERDAIIAEQAKALQLREHWVTERDGWIVERDAIINCLQEDITLQLSWIQERESWLSERDEMISKRDRWVADRDTWIAERDEWVAERDQLIASLHQEQSRLLNSRAYRLGSFILSPLRVLRERFGLSGWRHGHA